MASKQDLQLESTRRNKRLKVVSACGECRRKKIKCNGEKPCTSCAKTNMECDYSRSLKPKPPTGTPLLERKKSVSPSTSTTGTTPIHAIESRLTMIEDVLRALLASSSTSPSLSLSEKDTPLSPSMSENSDPSADRTLPTFGSRERDPASHKYLHSGPPSCSTVYNTRPVHPTRDKRQRHECDLSYTHFAQDDHFVRLPPLHRPQPPLSASSSSSSSSSFFPSPKLSAIRTLLNDTDQKQQLPSVNAPPLASLF
ncbi:Zn(2)-C6 fungal-specific transcription factor [Phycomyces blakesleeanus]|uniref:Zn(2)-C6 fungal-specific transcription factor n=2 Tax=Phycomyces blakesleeanus TaxID=4837 RepID=A0A167QJT3_PHYB8|nr:Zn(2)-C6 fungal-specific transcription factor [Phycomyces blakesleeanus NRRL 1555(-)]OAD79808.1 Zn(2)-C6 fungal-specific transcription factor [Phycomyces blakesleeanus NRRL 1555(-)]|eukprot:XP_018297848.1 Zn(2)-C6 fungal-specific transcription factor [Phycomyces blakesleeanus NRRL 1555(-)]